MDRALAGAGARLWDRGAPRADPRRAGPSEGRRTLPSDRPGRAGAIAAPDPEPPPAPDHLHPDHPGEAARAEEINDLWIKSSAQERLWAALKQADIEAERQYPLREDLPQYVADFALLCRDGKVAVIVDDEPGSANELHETMPPDYLLTAGGWLPLRITQAEMMSDPAGCAARLAALMASLGGPLVG